MTLHARHGRACPGHPRLAARSKTWMPGTRPGMTKAETMPFSLRHYRDGLDFVKRIRARQFRDLDRGRGRRIFGVDVAVAHFEVERQVRHVDQVIVELDDVLEG